MEVIPYWPSQHQEISKLALHRTQEYQAGSPVSFACRFVSVLIRFTVPGRYGSCRFGFYGSVRFAGTLMLELCDTQVFSGSVKSRSCGSDFLEKRDQLGEGKLYGTSSIGELEGLGSAGF